MQIGTLITLLVIANVVLLLLFGGFFIHVRRSTRRREKIQAKLLRDFAKRIPHIAHFPVRACDAERFGRFWKLFPWDRTGQLFVAEREATLVLVGRGGGGIVRTFPRLPERIAWIGQRFWPNGILNWIGVTSGDTTYYVTSETGMTVLNSEKSTRLLYDNLLADHPEALAHALTDKPEFALEKHPLSLAIIVLFFLLLVYSLIDTFFINAEDYVRFTFLPLVFVVGGAVAALTSVFTLRSRIPRGTSLILSLLLALAAAGCVYPGLLRLNQLTADGPPKQQIYHVDYAHARLVPADPQLPEIAVCMSATRDYWLQFAPEESYPVSLRKGGLGFYQIDMQPIQDSMGAFYKQRRH